jgi:gamma-glutamyltranspeptidase/glutathione hydrolase
MQAFRLPLALAALAVVAALVAFVPSLGAATPTHAYAVATESTAATREATRVLASGGNAVDAAVCAALVAGFSSPSSSGIGGGGFAMIWSARDRKPALLDFREIAPKGIIASALDQRPLASEKRGQAVGVPGEVAGLFELEQRFGKLAWRDVVLRAARLAQQGFEAEHHAVGQIAEQKQELLSGSATFRSVYLPGGNAPKLGQRLHATKLSKTLTRIANEGKRGFYDGPVATDIVSAVNAAGGSLELADLAGYQVASREPLRLNWGGKDILTMPPPSAGGFMLVQTLALFPPAELAALKDTPGKRIHLLAEAMRGASADRARFFGDPAFVNVDIAKLTWPARLLRRKATLAEDRTHTQPRFGLEDAGTHQIVTADDEGNWVTLTTTINNAFGAKVIGEQSGVILNDQLADFSTPDSVAPFGMTESPNRVRPGARPVSSMSPTLVLENGAPILALGGSGGLTIGPNVTQVLLNWLATGMPLDAAVAAPRFTICAPSTGQTVWLESALAKAYGADLTARGELWLSKDNFNAVQAVAREKGTFTAASDPRKHGSAAVSNPSVAAP